MRPVGKFLMTTTRHRVVKKRRTATICGVSAVLTPQLVDVVDTVAGIRSYSSGTVRQLNFWQVEPWGLRLECSTPDDPSTDAEISWLLPRDGLRLSFQRPRSRHALVGPSRLTAVHVQYDRRHWRCTDLLLGLAIKPNAMTRLIGSADFAAAVSGRVLRPADADRALQIVHRTLHQLANQRHSIGAWLHARGISTRWPAP